MIHFLERVFSPLANLTSGVLELFYSLGVAWSLSIILLTVMVRAALFPLAIRQVKNMRPIQDLKPEVDEIRSRHKDDRRKQQEATMDLQGAPGQPLAGFHARARADARFHNDLSGHPQSRGNHPELR